MWSRFRRSGPFAEMPYLLRFFDRISWYPVSSEELLELRAEMDAGRLDVRIEDGTFTLSEHLDFLDRESRSIAEFRAQQAAAFGAERAAWAAAGEFDPRPEPEIESPSRLLTLPPGAVLLEAPCTASVWRVEVRPGDSVSAGDRLLTLETMKMETGLDAPSHGKIIKMLVGVGDQVQAGAPLVVLAPGAPG